jgi:hypothetical protein
MTAAAANAAGRLCGVMARRPRLCPADAGSGINVPSLASLRGAASFRRRGNLNKAEMRPMTSPPEKIERAFPAAERSFREVRSPGSAHRGRAPRARCRAVPENVCCAGRLESIYHTPPAQSKSRDRRVIRRPLRPAPKCLIIVIWFGYEFQRPVDSPQEFPPSGVRVAARQFLFRTILRKRRERPPRPWNAGPGRRRTQG